VAKKNARKEGNKCFGGTRFLCCEKGVKGLRIHRRELNFLGRVKGFTWLKEKKKSGPNRLEKRVDEKREGTTGVGKFSRVSNFI